MIKVYLSGTVCPVSGIVKLIMADSRHFAFDQDDIFRPYFSLKPHILFHINGLAISQGLPNTIYFKVIYDW